MNEHKKFIGVLFGGKSPEHEVSVITGVQVLNNLDKEKYTAIPIYVSKEGVWYTSDKFLDIKTFTDLELIPYLSKEVYVTPTPTGVGLLTKKRTLLGKHKEIVIDVFFPCFHGGPGETGAFQGLLEMCEKPYVGSEVLGSALGMDKVLAKQVFAANNISTAPYVYYFSEDVQKDLDTLTGVLESKFNYPVFIKPAVGGSSVGVTKANNKEQLRSGLELASMLDSKVIIEQGIEHAHEINISVIGNTGGSLITSVCEEVFHKGEFLTYDDKYKGESGKTKGMASTSRQIPANLQPATVKCIEDAAIKVFTSLNCFGLARVDFLVKENPLEVNVLEINTIPGCLAFYLWEASKLPFKDMLSKLIDLATERHAIKSKKTVTFESNLLRNFSYSLKSPKFTQ